MPKVVYSKSKGLRQSTGEGFEVSEVAIRPSYESKIRQLVSGADVNKTGAQINGLYFIYYNKTQKVVVWFKSTDNASPASAPSVPSAHKFIQVDVVDATAKAVVVDNLKTAVDAADSTVTVIDTGAGVFKIEGNLPYAASGTASAGTLGTDVTQTVAGSGLNTLACETHGITVLEEDLTNYAAASAAYTLASGAHIGALKQIIRTGDHNTDMTLSVASGYIANDTTMAARTFTFGGDDDNTGKSLVLSWDGSGWVIVKMAAGVAVA